MLGWSASGIAFHAVRHDNPLYHAILQRWFKRNADLQRSNVVNLPDGIGEIAIPTLV